MQTYLPLTKWKDLDAETQNNIMDCVIADYTKGHVFLFLHDRDVDHIVLKSELRLICDYTDLYDS